MALSLFRRICRGCDLSFWWWEKHHHAACLKRREWHQESGRKLAARWESARRPIRDTKNGFVWTVACRCGCRQVEVTEYGATCPECGRAA